MRVASNVPQALPRGPYQADLVSCPVDNLTKNDADSVILTSEQSDEAKESRTASRFSGKPVPVSATGKRSTIT
jgi:hypothetical protein